MAEQLPLEVSDGEKLKTILTHGENFLKENSTSETSFVPSNLEYSVQPNAPTTPASNNGSCKLQEHRIEENNEVAGPSSSTTTEATVPPQSFENDSKSLIPSRSVREGESQVIEQFEPGVYVTLIVKPSGLKVFKRVRFRYYNYFLIQQILHFSISMLVCSVIMFERVTFISIWGYVYTILHVCVTKIITTRVPNII